MTHGPQKSDSPILATKSANKPGQPGAESMERGEKTKENARKPPASRTRSWEIGMGHD